MSSHTGVPYDHELAAFAVYGRGLHPQARLNLGDCATYALAKAMSAPLLFKGDDFAATDIVAAA
jgi:ribonuclease VapC